MSQSQATPNPYPYFAVAEARIYDVNSIRLTLVKSEHLTAQQLFDLADWLISVGDKAHWLEQNNSGKSDVSSVFSLTPYFAPVGPAGPAASTPTPTEGE